MCSVLVPEMPGVTAEIQHDLAECSRSEETVGEVLSLEWLASEGSRSGADTRDRPKHYCIERRLLVFLIFPVGAITGAITSANPIALH